MIDTVERYQCGAMKTGAPPGVVTHAFNPALGRQRRMDLRVFEATHRVPGQPGLHNEKERKR